MLNVTAFEAWASCSRKTKGCYKGLGKKFFFKTHMVLKNQDELGLSDKQVKEIKDLKMKTKKDLIRKKAEIDLVALDIKVAMHEEQIDTGAIDKLIDQKYDLKKEKAKSLVGAYAAVKGTLTDEQKSKLKSLWKKCKKEMMQGAMMKGKMKHPMMSGKR
ncbi:unnamed protein product [marine sediment metagenome]|uniref:Periplasmic heavy metal sensor n=1 Tax=marine sediment metagenome TaxID=412755 RepID=X0W6M2_9ZZZZ